MKIQKPMDAAIDHLVHSDKVLKDLIHRYPVPEIHSHTDYYQELVDSIISQQLSVRAAAAIEARFKALYGDNFPTPEQIINTDIETLRGVGISRPKAHYIQDLASKIKDGSLDFSCFEELSNEAIVANLIKVKGIGQWTADVFLIFCMGRLDVLPVGDLGIRNGIAKLYSFDHVPDAGEITAIAKQHNWHPYESVASWYVWQSLENKPVL